MQRHLDDPVARSPVLRGACCDLGASLMMALMGGAVRMASTEIPNEMLVFLRNAFGLLALWPWIRTVGLSGLLAAIAMVSLRAWPERAAGSAVVYFSAIGTVVSAVPLVWAWETPAPLTLLVMGAAGIFATLGQILLTTGYLLAPAARVGGS